MDRTLLEQRVRPALAAWWAPRLYRIADWVAAEEALRRSATPLARIAPECRGKWPLDVLGGFLLRGRADRIEVRADGRLAILDYKTGRMPARGEAEGGHAPQLPLEAAMALAGAFGEALRAEVAELTYWRLTGAATPGEARSLFEGDAVALASAAREAEARLRALIAAFDQPDRAYLSAPHPGRASRFDDYAQLARRAEWASGAEDA